MLLIVSLDSQQTHKVGTTFQLAGDNAERGMLVAMVTQQKEAIFLKSYFGFKEQKSLKYSQLWSESFKYERCAHPGLSTPLGAC